jgi:hypothetical protein
VLKSNATHTVLRFGLPLEGYSSPDNRRKEHEAEAGAFSVWMVSEVLAKERAAMKEAGGPLETLYFGGSAIFESMVQENLRGDAMFAVGSIVFVLLYLWFHTMSLFLAALGMLHIVLSFPVSFFFLQCGLRDPLL